jgi:hypothetical protein
LLLRRYTFSFILNFNEESVIFLMQAYRCGNPPGMTVNICEALLDHPENGNFHFVGQPAKLVWDLQVNFDPAAFREAIHVPAKRGRKAGRIKQGRVQ